MAMDHAFACAASLFPCQEVVEAPLLNSLFSFKQGLKMFIIEDKAGAIAIMCASLLFLGTWPAVLTLLERRGRLPQHTYLDYSITNLLAAVLIALTFGQLGESKHNMPNFFTQLSQDNWPSVLFAMAGGVVLSIGNLSTQYAWAYVGLSVTEVISSSMVVVIGTTLNYFLDNRINKAEILFTGVAFFLVAVILGSAVHASNAADNEKKLSGSTNSYKLGTNGDVEPSKQVIDKDAPKDMENGASPSKYVTKAEAGTAEYLIELEERRSIKVFGSSTFIGLGIVFFSGVCFSLFSPAINLATNDQWHTLKDGVPHLVVYTAFFYFSISCFVVAIGLNILFLYRPMAGVPKSSFKAYLNDWEGIATCKHILGHPAIRRVPKVVEENIHSAWVHAIHVRRSGCNSDGFIRSQDHRVMDPILSSLLVVVFASANHSCCRKVEKFRQQGKAPGPGRKACQHKVNSIHEISV